MVDTGAGRGKNHAVGRRTLAILAVGAVLSLALAAYAQSIAPPPIPHRISSHATTTGEFGDLHVITNKPALTDSPGYEFSYTRLSAAKWTESEPLHPSLPESSFLIPQPLAYPDGSVCIYWADSALLESCRSEAGWAAPESVQAGPADSTYSVALTPGGELRAIRTSPDPNTIVGNYFGAVRIDTSGNPVFAATLAVDHEDGLHAFWYDHGPDRAGRGYLWSYSGDGGASWSGGEMISASSATYGSIATLRDHQGIHLFLVNETQIEYRRWSPEGGWSPTVIQPTRSSGLRLEVAQSPGGTIYAVMASNSGGFLHTVDPETGAVATTPLLGSEGLFVDRVFVAADDWGNVATFWREQNVAGFRTFQVATGEAPEEPPPPQTTTTSTSTTTPAVTDTTVAPPTTLAPPSGDNEPGEAVEPPPPQVRPEVPLLVSSVPSVQDISLEPVVLTVSAVLAVAVIMLMPFPAELFNTTFMDNYEKIRSWFPWLTRREREPRKRRFWDTIPGLCVFLVLCAVLNGFLDPEFGLSSGLLFLMLLVGVALTNVGLWLPDSLMRRKTNGDRGRLRALPLGLVVAALCVLVSRLIGFVPGYMYAAVVALVFTMPAGDDQEDRETPVTVFTLFAAGLVAWFLLGVVRSAEGPVFIEGVLAILTVATFEVLAVGLLPLRGLLGHKMMRAGRARWLIMWGLSLFAFFHIVINPANGYLTSSALVPLATTITLLLVFSAVSVWLWWHFNRRRAKT